jgi:hypothetical protein
MELPASQLTLCSDLDIETTGIYTVLKTANACDAYASQAQNFPQR